MSATLGCWFVGFHIKKLAELNRVTLVGAVFLGIIAVLPNIVQRSTSVTDFAVGGTSILIVVSVALEIMKQLDAQLSMYEY